MRAAGITLNVISYSAAISACEKGQHWQRALELLEDRRAAGITSNVISYSAAISACEKRQQWQAALKNKACTANFSPGDLWALLSCATQENKDACASVEGRVSFPVLPGHCPALRDKGTIVTGWVAR